MLLGVKLFVWVSVIVEAAIVVRSVRDDDVAPTVHPMRPALQMLSRPFAALERVDACRRKRGRALLQSGPHP
jgi:hypothetical protein